MEGGARGVKGGTREDDAPVDVLLLGGEEHPRVGEEAGEPEGGVNRPDDARQTTRAQNPVRLGDAPLGLGPVLNATGRHIPVLAVRLEREVLRVALDKAR